MKEWLVGGIIISFLAFGIFLSISNWNECRQTNSFFYCTQVLSK